MPALLELRNVTVMRGEQVALRRVDMRIERGERVCILGPNGCGKSTLIKTIARECYPLADDGSSMTILGNERWDVAELRKRLGIVTPDVVSACSTDATALEVALSGFFSSTRLFPHHGVVPELVARAHEALSRLGISHLAGRRVATLSSGEAKRALIARALVHRPETLLLDEPGSALDVGAQAQLWETMRSLARSGLGILLVTHHVSEIIPEIDRVILLQEGRVVADGPTEEMLTTESLELLFRVRAHLVRREGRFNLIF
ncbi:MAG TPA: ATP-binding cassette domain-containing protein [Polyangiaceae bacterium]|nr:ATP-binding cassette domain-containing protein [Polyangiaceae bacterium]